MQSESLPRKIDASVFYGLLVLLVFAPLAFGSVHVWAYSILEIGVFVLLALWFAGRLIAAGESTLTWVKTPVNLLLVLFLTLVALQLLPLPASVVSVLSPRTYADKTELFSILAKASESPADGPAWMTLTYSAFPTLREWLKLATYASMFFLVINTLNSKNRINILIYTLVGVGLFEALYAIYQVFSGNPKVWWWVSRVGHSRYASGTFIVSNHFAIYMEMVICLAFGFMLAHRKKTERLVSNLGGARERLQKIVHAFSPESARPKTILLFFSGIVMGVALLMSASRGGIFSLACALFIMAVIFLFKKPFRKYALLTVCFCLIVLIYALHLGIDPTLQKLERSQDGLQNRLTVARSILPIITDYPAFGVGSGNLRYLYPRYIVDYDRVKGSGHAHNDWLEAGTETGFTGLALVLGLFLTYLYRTTRLWRQRRDRHALGVGAGVVAGLLAVSIHSVFEFGMHIPANPLTLAAVLGLGYAALHRRGHGFSESFFYRRQQIALTPWRQGPIFAVVLVLAGFGVYTAGAHFRAEAVCPSEWNSTMNLNWQPALADIDSAIRITPRNFEYHVKRAQHFMALTPENQTERDVFNQASQQSLEQAVRLNPAYGVAWYRLGAVYSFNKLHLYEYLNKWLPLAERCFEVTAKCEPRNAALLFSIGRYWVWRARLLPEQPAGNAPSRQQGIDRFQHYFKQALALNPSPWEAAVRHVWEYFPQDATVMGIVPVTDPDLRSRVLQFLVKLPPPAPLVAALPQTALKAPDTEPEAPSNSAEQDEKEVLSKTDGDQPPASPPAITEKTIQEVPAEKTTQEAPPEKTAQQTAAPRSPAKRFHTVQSGENLFRIGLRYGLTVDVLRRMNQMDEGDTIYPGQELVVGVQE